MTSEIPEIEDALQSAFERPSHDTVRHFYSLFLSSTFFVPRRFQAKELSNLATFPSPFTDVLAVTSKDETYIPVFTSLEEMKDWSREELEYHELSGQEVCRRAPDGWWITLNPDGNWGKEISPWEVERLRDGEPALEEIVAEQLQGEEVAVSFRPLEEETVQHLSQELSPLLQELGEFQALYGGIHASEIDGDRYLFGIVHSAKEISEELRTQIENALSHALIGDLPIDTYFGKNLDESPALALFRFSDPILLRPSAGKHKETTE